MPQSQPFFHPSFFGTRRKLSWMSETFRIGVKLFAIMVILSIREKHGD